MTFLRFALAVVLTAGLTTLSACDSTTVSDVVVTYSVEGYGDFPASSVQYVEFTNSARQIERRENQGIPMVITEHIRGGTDVKLEARVVAPSNESGLRIRISADGTELASSSGAGSDATGTVSRTLSLTETLPTP